MWDMVRADNYVGEYLLKDSTKMKIDESVKLYYRIFQLHHTTKEEFRKSFDYYSSRPDLFRPIIDSLAARREEHAPFFDKPANKINKDSVFKSHHPVAK